jgi:phosphoserine phosphatase
MFNALGAKMTAVAEKFDAALVQDTCNEAAIQARTAAKAFFQQHGDRDACGFAWVNVWGVRSNSRLGKTLQSYGFRKSWDGAPQLWNPSQAGTQSISILEAGAEAYAKVLREKLGLDKVYAGSRLD